jgi:oligopeptidase A
VSAPGTFYVDLFPRENKRGGAWMNGARRRAPRADGGRTSRSSARTRRRRWVSALRCSPREVETLFHEFGHLLHQLLSRVPVRSLAGTNVAWDFVELPSQIMENWTWEREALDLFARTTRRAEPIPDELFEA